MSNSTCVMYEDGTFYLQVCTDKDTPYCIPATQAGMNSTCQQAPPPPIGFAWPGESCTSQLDCAEGTCTNSVCVGVSSGGTCGANDECQPGFYCFSNKCTPQVALHGICTADYDCVNSAGCNFTSPTQGTCVPYLSIASGSPVGSCTNNQNYLCGSGTCASSSNQTYCIQEPESFAQPPLKCSSDGDCFSLPVMGTVLTSKCSCSYNPWGMSFCQLFPGDEIGVTVRKYLYTWFASGNSTNCNTMRRMSLNCVKDYYNQEDYLWLAYHMTWFDDFSQVQFLDNCGQQIYMQDYWSIKYDFNHYNSNFTDTNDYSAGGWLALTVCIGLTVV